MRCEDALKVLAAYLDGELPGADEKALNHHLGTCRSCYSRAEFERRLKSELGRLREHPLEAAFRERIDGLLRQFVRQAGDDGSSRPSETL
jgi:anti-sigma factor RsiW